MRSSMSIKIISAFLVILLLVPLISSTAVTVNASSQDDFEFLFGDMNGDGTIDFINDCLAINALRERDDITEEQKIMADVNGDGIVDYSDVECLNEVRQNGDFYSLPIYSQLTKAGFCGEAVKYMLYRNGELIIFGEGSMKISSGTGPWGQGVSSIDIKNGVTDIGIYAFRGCASLNSVVIPSTVTKIGQRAFLECTGIQEISLPNSITTIDLCAFEQCSSLTSMVIPDSVTTINTQAFCKCTNLNSLHIGKNLSNIGTGAFSHCYALSSITVDENNTFFDSRNNCNAIIKTEDDSLYFGCRNTTIPNSVIAIGRQAFWYCTGLTEITIPNSVTSIGDSAFNGCSNLEKITIPKTVTNISNSSFNSCNKLTIYGYSNSVAETYANTNNIPFVNLNEKSLVSISVSKQPNKTIYSIGEALDTTGLQIKLSYDDGSSSYVTSGFTTSGFSSSSTGTKTVTVTYQSKTTTFTVTINSQESNAMIIADSVTADPGDTVDVIISLNNNPGIVAATIKVNFDSSTLTLTKVTDAGVLGAQSHKPEYTSPYTLAWANDTATTNYTVNGTVATLTFKVGNNAVRGQTYPITLSYNYNNYEIYDKDLNPVQFGITNGSIAISQTKVLSSISVNTQPNKISYFVGESLDTTGLQLKLNYDDGSTGTATSGFTTSGFSSASAGSKTVTVTYQGKTTTFKVTVQNKSLTSISVSKQPTKTTYFVGETLDTTGLQLKLNYDDGSTSYVSSDFTPSGFNSASAGTKTVTVTYQDKTTTFTVTVNAVSNAKISAESVTADPGNTVDVSISLSNNPGIVAATIKVEYNSSVLTLTKVTDASVLGAQSHKPEYTSPYTLAWANDTATTNYTVNGTIATLTFKVGNNAVRGQSYPITLSYNYNNYEIYDKDLNLVQFDVTSGSIDISQFQPELKVLGDVDGSGKVDIVDATFIQRYATEIGTPYSELIEAYGDVDSNGKTDIVDATFVQRYATEISTPYPIGQEI